MIVNPSGAKQLRRFYKAGTGLRGTYAQALDYYSALKEPRFRTGESKQHIGLTLLAEALRKRI
mgnify:FL=1